MLQVRSFHSCRCLRINVWDAMNDKRDRKEIKRDGPLHKKSDPNTYSRVTAAQAALSKQMPINARMLTRDFIHNSLYHPTYGYFSKRAKIFSPGISIFNN
jgi:hypothetical protein